ncbi:hypothetical protein [Paenibacillus sp. QZ-Y1]|uniref:hypothetical protein n=1 Tax=Paenibacillus sp. QZ-Y1 TaxID=3414511 RepID=UPI003F78EC34
MTYSQRLNDDISSSDIIYLEYQISVTEEELKKANEERLQSQSDLDRVEAWIETLHTRLANLQDDLAKLGD